LQLLTNKPTIYKNGKTGDSCSCIENLVRTFVPFLESNLKRELFNLGEAKVLHLIY